jgi:hypothetical protein
MDKGMSLRGQRIGWPEDFWNDRYEMLWQRRSMVKQNLMGVLRRRKSK